MTRDIDSKEENGHNRGSHLASKSIADKIRSPRVLFVIAAFVVYMYDVSWAFELGGSIGARGRGIPPSSSRFSSTPVRLSRRKFGISPENAASPGVHPEYNITPAAESFSPTPTNRHLTSRVSQKRESCAGSRVREPRGQISVWRSV